MLRFEGDQDLAPPPGELWAKLSDARFLVRCVPDIETVTRLEANSAVFILRPGLSFARGTLEVTLHAAEAIPGQSAKYVLHSKGIGSTSDVEASLAIQPRDTGSRVHWTVEIKQLGGLLKAVPGGLIQAAAKKVVSDAWVAVENQLRQEARPPAAE
jgi:carbon monoxide dehydrogenase subunit G